MAIYCYCSYQARVLHVVFSRDLELNACMCIMCISALCLILYKKFIEAWHRIYGMSLN